MRIFPASHDDYSQCLGVPLGAGVGLISFLLLIKGSCDSWLTVYYANEILLLWDFASVVNLILGVTQIAAAVFGLIAAPGWYREGARTADAALHATLFNCVFGLVMQTVSWTMQIKGVGQEPWEPSSREKFGMGLYSGFNLLFFASAYWIFGVFKSFQAVVACGGRGWDYKNFESYGGSRVTREEILSLQKAQEAAELQKAIDRGEEVKPAKKAWGIRPLYGLSPDTEWRSNVVPPPPAIEVVGAPLAESKGPKSDADEPKADPILKELAQPPTTTTTTTEKGPVQSDQSRDLARAEERKTDQPAQVLREAAEAEKRAPEREAVAAAPKSRGEAKEAALIESNMGSIDAFGVEDAAAQAAALSHYETVHAAFGKEEGDDEDENKFT